MPKHLINAAQVDAAVIMYKGGMRCGAISKILGLKSNTIYYHVHGRAKSVVPSDPIETARILRETADKLERQHGPDS